MEFSQLTEKLTASAQIYIRYFEVTLFVVIYIVIGYLLKLKVEYYLFAGIPLTLIFQLFIRKQPIHKLWLRDTGKFHLNRAGWIFAIGFLILPTYKIITTIIHDQWTLGAIVYNLVAMMGAFGAAYCFSSFTKQTIKDFLVCAALCALIRMAMYLLPVLLNNRTLHPDYLHGLSSLLTYIPVAFVVEEVVFRGMLDSHIYSDQKSPGLFSAFFISALWGLWHLPITPVSNTSIWVVSMIVIAKASWGILLSLFWRKSGNMAVPAFSHALVDAIRDANI